MLDKAFVSFRVGTNLWLDDRAFQALLDLFDRHPGVTDDIVFFTSCTHPPLPVDKIKYHADILKERLNDARKRGYGAGINILSTIGHHVENLPHSLTGDYTWMTSLDGKVCKGTLCPASDTTYAYISEVYRALTLAEPDYIYIDDDVRLFGHVPIDAGCFCDACLACFTRETGIACSRESLQAAFNTSTVSDKLQMRLKWIEHNRKVMRDLLAHIENTVHEISPDMKLGFMTGDRFFEGYDFTNWANTLAGPNGVEVLWRPGGGFYADERMSDLAGKSHDIGRQVSALPQSVKCIQSEIENFPYQSLKKGPAVTALEAASHIAAGCTGAAFNVLTANPIIDWENPFHEHERIVDNLADARPFYDLLVRTMGRSEPQGIYTGWNKNTYAANNLCGEWFEFGKDQVGQYAHEMFEIGLPAAYKPENARVTLLTGDQVYALSDDEITHILSSGVYLDYLALTRLNEQGYSDLTGFRVVDTIDVDAIEEMLESPVAPGLAGAQRDCRQSFIWWHYPAAVLEPVANNVQVLSRLLDYSGNVTAPITSGTYENRLGGRVFVAGYYPWTYLQDLYKSTQIKHIMRWLSHDSLPAYVTSFHRVNCWVRLLENDTPVITVTNANIEPAVGLTLAVRTQRDTLWLRTPQMGDTAVLCTGNDGPYKIFELPEIGAWEMCLLSV